MRRGTSGPGLEEAIPTEKCALITERQTVKEEAIPEEEATKSLRNAGLMSNRNRVRMLLEQRKKAIWNREGWRWAGALE